MAENYDELLRFLEIHSSALCLNATKAIRALQAENERLRESDARWSVFAEECGKEHTILEDQRDEARRELAALRRDETRNERDDLRVRLAEALFREGKACKERDEAEAKLETLENEQMHDYAALKRVTEERDEEKAMRQDAEKRLAALREKAEALEALLRRVECVCLATHPHARRMREGLDNGECARRLKVVGPGFDPTGTVELLLAIRAALGRGGK